MFTVSNYLAISGFVIAFFAVMLGAIAISKKRNKLHLLFVLWCLSIAVWSLPYGVWLLSSSYDTALLFARILTIGSILIPIFHLHCVSVFLDQERKLKPILILGYIVALFFLLFSFTPWMVGTVEATFGFMFWPKPGILYHFFLAGFFMPCFIYSFVAILIRYIGSRGQSRAQLRFIFFGVTLGVIAGSTNFALWYNINLPPYANPLVIVYMSAYAYAIIRYRLMDIRLAVRRSFVYLNLAVFTYVMFYVVAYCYTQIFGSVFAPQTYILGLVLALVFVLSFPLIQKNAIRFANRYLYANIYNTQETLKQTINKLTTIVQLSELVNLITETVIKTLGVSRVAVLLKDNEKNNFVLLKAVGYDRARTPWLVKDSPLTQRLAKQKKALVYDEILLWKRSALGAKDQKHFENLGRAMVRIRAALLLPLIARKNLLGFIVLGERQNYDAFTSEDIELLETLANQAAIALENAQFYNQMEELVAEQTKDLRDKNLHLEKLLKMRSEFLDIASHQLRTPVSVIKGYVSMLLEGDYREAKEEERREAYQAIAQKTEKLRHIINDILYASELDTGAFELRQRDLEKIELISFIKNRLTDHGEQARSKNITLSLEAGSDAPIKALVAPRYLEVVLDNLISNALTYTAPLGKVTVHVIPKTEVVRIEVIDTGIGIPPENQPKLFTKFSRGNNANTMHTDGSGLGLFIVKKMIEAHPQGRVGFKSALNQGTTFWVEVKRAI